KRMARFTAREKSGSDKCNGRISDIAISECGNLMPMKNFDVMRGTKSRTGKLLGLIVTCLMMACTAPQRDVPLVVDVDAPSFVYTRYLAFPVPSSGIEAEFNPPVLRWPIKKGK